MNNFFSNVSFNREVRNPKRKLKITSMTVASVEINWKDKIMQKATAAKKNPRIKHLSANVTGFIDAP